MSLFKRGNVWWSYFFVDGVRHQQSTETANKKQAETIEQKLKEEVTARRFGLVQADPHMKFGEVAAKFIASGIAKKHHLYHLKFLLPFFADVPVLRLTKPMTEEFRRKRKAEPIIRPIKDATVNRDLSVLRHILYWAVDERLLEVNPLARLKMARERRTRRPVLSVAEEQLLLGAAPPHLYAMTMAALDTGMRRGEITNQLWEDIDFPRRVLFVTRSKTPEGESREIPLTARLFRWISENRQGQGPVFGYHGEQVQFVKRSWSTALKHAGIRHVRFHDLRHTFNTRLMEAGVLQEIRMALMGHSAGSKVHAIYTHIELPAKREAIGKLEGWVNQQQQQITKQENDNASTERERSQTDGSKSASGSQDRKAGTQSVEEEDAR